MITFNFKFEKYVDNHENGLSRVELNESVITPELINKKAKDFEILFTNSKFENGKEFIHDQIIKLKNGLILYLCREQDTNLFRQKIYYNPSQINEIKMFLNSIKLWKE